MFHEAVLFSMFQSEINTSSVRPCQPLMGLNHFLGKPKHTPSRILRARRVHKTDRGYVARPNGNFLNPLPPSSKSAYITNFEFIGTIDNAPYLCIPTALKYREQIGGEAAILEHCHALARSAAKRISEALGGTEILENEEGTLGNCCMSNVKLPLQLAEIVGIAKGEDVGMRIMNWITSLLVREYNTFMAIMWYDNAWWVRLSAQVYLEMEDFEWAAKVLTEICGRVMKGDFLVVE